MYYDQFPDGTDIEEMWVDGHLGQPAEQRTAAFQAELRHERGEEPLLPVGEATELLLSDYLFEMCFSTTHPIQHGSALGETLDEMLA